MSTSTVAPFYRPVSPAFQYIPEWDNFLALFPHRGSYLWADHPKVGQPPEWRTETRHLLSDRLIQQGSYLYGVRFGKITNYLMLDIDRSSRYHPYRDPFAIQRLVDALEPLGLLRHVAVSSSYSDGIHLYFPFMMGQTSWAIAKAAAVLLENAGFKLERGQLELFPNPRLNNATDYNGHRLPLQAGSYLLNADYQAIYGGRDEFVRAWYQAQNQNPITTDAIQQVLKQSDRRPNYKLKASAQKFLHDLNAEIEVGWTGYGQTNRLVGRIAMREYIFHHVVYGGAPLTGINLGFRVLEVVLHLPGYQEWCRHHHDIHYVCEYWCRSIELDERYYPYQGDRVELPTEREWQPPTPNEQKAMDAQNRIRQAVAAMQAAGTLPTGVRDRLFALKYAGISATTLYKYRELWHPHHLPKPPESAADALIHTIVAETTDPETLQPAASKVIHTIAPISLYSEFDRAPQGHKVKSDTSSAVGGGEGVFHSPPLLSSTGVESVQATLQAIRDRRPLPCSLPLDVPPDERWFQQHFLFLEVFDMPITGDQLSLFDPLPPADASDESLPSSFSLPSLPALQDLEQTCTDFVMMGDRPSLITYLTCCCEAGHAVLVQEVCRMRPDYGLKVVDGQMVEFFQVGDWIRIFRNGQFYNKVAQIIALAEGVATVRGDGWVVDHQYSVGEIRLVKRSKEGNQNG